MKNIHILPTDKPSKIHFDGKLFISTNSQISREINSIVEGRNIYITSDEEIKEDYVIAYGFVIKVMMFEEETLYFINGTKAKREDCKKIILTTDQDLIKDGVQVINDDFLEWFIKNPSCEEVEVEKLEGRYVDYSGNVHIPINYKIIIPKEEPKQEKFEHILYKGNVWEPPVQETLEDLVNKMKILDDRVDLFGYSLGLKDGAKWQQEQILNFLYSEITKRRDYSASKMCEKVIEFIGNLKNK